MLDDYPPVAQKLAAEAHREGMPVLVWLGDSKDRTPEQLSIAANLAHMFGGVLIVDRDAA